MDEQAHKRILQITEAILTDKIIKGELNPEDEKALREAAKEAAQMAKAVYYAALEYISG